MLKGKTAIVTGSGQGIGQGIALALAEKGARVVIADINLESADKVARDLVSRGHEATAVKTDITSGGDVDKLAAAAVDRFGGIDILVNNAGVILQAPLLEMTEDAWDTVMKVDLKGTFLCGRAAAREMIKRGGGKIINIASNTAHAAPPNIAAYCASKAGVIALTRSMAVEWAKYGINVNSISPGRTETAMVESRRKQNTADDIAREKRIPLGRTGRVEDIANLVLFLAGPQSDYITGEDILVDGGIIAIHPRHA